MLEVGREVNRSPKFHLRFVEVMQRFQSLLLHLSLEREHLSVVIIHDQNVFRCCIYVLSDSEVPFEPGMFNHMSWAFDLYHHKCVLGRLLGLLLFLSFFLFLIIIVHSFTDE